MNKTIGFIGAGNMAQAIITGIVNSALVSPDKVLAYDVLAEKTAELHDSLGITACASTLEVAAGSDILFLAVKPYLVAQVLQEMAGRLRPDTVVVSIAAGVTLAKLAEASSKAVKLVRAMPNTPALVNAGMSSLTPNKLVTTEEMADIQAIFASFGRAEVVPESLIHAVTGVSGSAPAYVFMFIEAMADAAVLGGMPRAQAYQFAAQTVAGAARMVLETGQHPGALKDMVCSPGGTTIEAVKVLEERGLRAAVMEAIERCMDKSERMSKQ